MKNSATSGKNLGAPIFSDLLKNLACGIVYGEPSSNLTRFLQLIASAGIPEENISCISTISDFSIIKKCSSEIFFLLEDAATAQTASQIRQTHPTTPMVLLSKKNMAAKEKMLELGIKDHLDVEAINEQQLDQVIFQNLKNPLLPAQKFAGSVDSNIGQKYKALFENALVAILFTKPDGSILDCNEAAEKLLEYPKQEILAHGRRLFLDHTDPVLHKHLKNRRKNKSSKGEVTIRTKHGKEVTCLFTSTLFIGDDGEEYSTTILLNIHDRKKANLALRESEQRFKALVQDGSDMIGILDEAGNYQYVSPTSTTIIGIAPEEFIGKNAFDFLHPEDLNMVMEQFEKLQTVQQVKIEPFRFKDKMGEWQWITTTATNLKHQKSIAGIVTNSRVITAHVVMEQQLRQALQKLNNIMDSSLDMICTLNAQGQFVSVSKASEEILGYPPTELEGRRATDFVHQDDLNLTVQVAKTIMSGKNLTNFENRYIKKDGSLVHLVWSGHWNAEQQLMFTVARDATERMHTDMQLKEMNDELRQSNERFLYSLKATNETIWAYDVATGDLVWSEGIERHYGHSLKDNKETIQEWAEKIHERDRKRVSESFRKAIESEEDNFWFEKYQFVKNNGEICHVLDRGYIIRDSNGKSKKIVGAVLDITENHKKSLEIEEKNKKLMEITWMQSHLVRAPLARIMGLVAVIENAPDGKERKEAFEYLKVSAHELDKITRDIVKKSEQVKKE